MKTLAEQFCNPGNVKNEAGNEWMGSNDTDERGHAVFCSPEFGCRAMIRTLAAKYLNGRQSAAAIIASWAPASDTVGSVSGGQRNNPAEYARTVSDWMNVRPKQDLYLFQSCGAIECHDRLFELCRCIEKYEAGHTWVPMSKWYAGASMYLRDFVEK